MSDSKKQFIAKQSQASKKLFKEAVRPDAPTTLPPDLVDTIKPIVKATSVTAITRFNSYFRVYKQVQKRLEYLQSVLDHRRSEEGWRIDNDLSLDDDIYSHYANWVGHYDFVKSVSALLDITNTIDHSSVSDDEMTKIIITEWRYYIRDNPKKVLDILFEMPKKTKLPMDGLERQLINMQNQSRRAITIQRLKNEVSQCHARGWYFVFDSLTLAPDMVKKFYQDKTAIRNYTRNFGRMVNVAMGRKASDSYSDVYRYFCVPEYGSKNGRLHFHVLHCMARLPLGSQDPNFGRSIRNAGVIDSCRGHWLYGFSAPIGVRYANDAFTRDGWLLPVDSEGRPKLVKPIDAVCNYIAKYVSKNADFKTKHKTQKDQDKWLRTIETIVPKNLMNQTFRVRMSRGFGMNLPELSSLSNEALMQLTNLHWTVTPLNRIVREKSRRQLAFRVGMLTIENLQDVMPETLNLVKSLRLSTQMTQNPNWQNFTDSTMPSLTIMDISEEVKGYVDSLSVQHSKERFQERLGTK